MTGGYGPTNYAAANSQQQTGANQNSFNQQQQATGGTSSQPNFMSFVQRRQRRAQGGSTPYPQPQPTLQAQPQTQSGGVGQMQSPVMANGQMSVQPLIWQAPTPPPAPPPVDLSAVPQQYQKIAQSYAKNLGRAGSEPEWQNWVNNPDYEKHISGSPEAQKFAQQQQAIAEQHKKQQAMPMVNDAYFQRYTVDPNVISQFQPPSNPMLDSQQLSMVQRMLSTPETMTPEAVAALKAKQMETAMALQSQQLRGIQGNAAARGVTGGGNQFAQSNVVRNQTGQNILGAYRDIDLAKLEQDRLDQVQALDVANQFQNSQLNRAATGYQTQLQGQTAREAVRSDAANSGQRAQQLGLQWLLGSQGIGLDQDRLAQQADQFNKGYGLDIAQFLEARRQAGVQQGNFNNNLAYQYALLNSNNNNNSMDFFRSLFGAV